MAARGPRHCRTLHIGQPHAPLTRVRTPWLLRDDLQAFRVRGAREGTAKGRICTPSGIAADGVRAGYAPTRLTPLPATTVRVWGCTLGGPAKSQDSRQIRRATVPHSIRPQHAPNSLNRFATMRALHFRHVQIHVGLCMGVSCVIEEGR